MTRLEAESFLSPQYHLRGRPTARPLVPSGKRYGLAVVSGSRPCSKDIQKAPRDFPLLCSDFVRAFCSELQRVWESWGALLCRSPRSSCQTCQRTGEASHRSTRIRPCCCFAQIVHPKPRGVARIGKVVGSRLLPSKHHMRTGSPTSHRSPWSGYPEKTCCFA